MILFWRGAGGLVLLFGIVAAVVVNVVIAVVSDRGDYFSTHPWVQAFTLWLAGAASWFTGRYFNGRPGKEVIDKQTGQTIILKQVHDFMFIKLEYWGPIYFAIGAAVLIVGYVWR